MGLAIFLSLSAVSITISEGHINLNLRNYPVVILLLVGFSIVLALIYIRIDKQKIKILSNHIGDKSKPKDQDFNSLLIKLTSRQNEVYNLILAGKSNKEIMDELFIEQSTLKSHINQIYKKLEIRNRKDLKSRTANS